jgi:AcrR family transcriptional regulator
MTSLERERAAHPGTSVHSVVTRLRALRDELPPGDGVAIFTRVYLSVTEEVQRRLDRGWFRDRRAAATLGAVFAERFLRAVADTRPTACWRPLFQLRHHPHVHPLQFALAGINAHVGHDLALAVVDTCHLLQAEPERIEGDYQRVGEALCEIEERVREELMPGPDLLDIADPLTHLVGSWSLERARDAAWAAACVLWNLRELPALAAEFTQRMDQGTGLVTRCLLTPVRGR